MIEVNQLCGQLYLGKQGENLARIVYFEEHALWEKEFGEGKCELLHQRNGDVAPYPVKLEKENGKCCWKITAADTAIVGDGKCELHYIVNDVVVKSKVFKTTVIESLGGEVAEAPEPEKAWVDAVLDAAQKVEDGTVHPPMIGENNTWLVWDFDTSEYIDTGINAEGTPGADGKGIESMGYYDTDADGNVGIAVFYTDGTIGFIWIPGLKGEKGEDGYTPVKGVDYWTEEDKAEIISEIPKGGTWKTLIDTTLTEDQAGVSKVAIEIPDGANILRTATRLRMWIEIAIPEDMASQTIRIQISDYNGQAYSAHLCWSSASAKAGQTLYYLGVTEIFPVTTLNRRECITFYSAPNVYTGANAANSPTKIHSDVRLTGLSALPPYFVVYLANGGIMGAGTKIFVEACE